MMNQKSSVRVTSFSLCISILFTLFFYAFALAGDGTTYADLSGWIQEGNLAYGNWAVSGAGNEFVSQSINGQPTMYVSPANFLNGKLNGTFEVETTGDDDFIGFVFGYQSPISANGDPSNIHNYYIFSWKQGNQGSALAGFTLQRLTNFDSNVSGNLSNCFWYRNDMPAAGCTMIASDISPARGWADNTEYEFELEYRDDLIKITIDGGIYNNEVIFNETFPVGTNPAGQFGFYNYSQSNVKYGEFISDGDPPVANNDTYTTKVNTPLEVNALFEGILSNDINSTLNVFTATVVSAPANGTVSVNLDGTFTYTPTNGFFGTDTFTYVNNDSCQDSNLGIVNIEVIPCVDLSITKTCSPSVIAGNQFTCRLTVANAGPVDANDVDVTDLLPFGVDIVSITPSFPDTEGECSLGGSCQINTIATGDSETIDLTLLVDSGYQPNTITNQAFVSSDETEAVTANNEDDAVINVTRSADLVLEKRSLDNVVNPGEGFLYEVVVTNNGPSDAQNVSVADTLDNNVTYSGGSPDCTHSGAANGGTVTCTDTYLEAGDSVSFLIAVTAGSVADNTVLNNSATVSSSTADPVSGNNTGTATTTVKNEVVVEPLADLEVVKTQNPAGTVTAGNQVTYQLAVENNGPDTATNVQLLDLIPSGASVDSISTTVGFCTLAGVCNLGDMTNNATATVTIVMTVDADFTGNGITNQAQVDADTDDPTTGNNIDGVKTAINQSTDLALTKRSLDDRVNPDEGFLYQVDVTNNGPSDAQGVTVTDLLDANTTFSGASPSCTHDGSATGGTVTCTDSTLPAGATSSYFIAVTANDVVNGTVLINQAAVSATTTDPNAGNNSGNANTTVDNLPAPSADLSVTKVQNPAGAVVAGQTVSYNITVNNNGPDDATNVQLLDLIPAGTSINSITPSVGFCTMGGVCDLGSIVNGASATIALVLQVAPSFSGTSITNQAQVSAAEADPKAGNNIDSAVTAVSSSATIEIEKADLADPVIAGETIPYQITVTNTGSSDAVDVVIVDAIPAGTTFAGASPVCSHAAGIVTCPVGTLTPGETTSVFVEVRTATSTANGTTMTNQVKAEGDNTNNVTDSEETTINQSALGPVDLQLEKSITAPAGGTVTAGNQVTYEIEVTNNTAIAAVNVLVHDMMPSDLSYVSHSIAPSTGAGAGSGSGTRICTNDFTCALRDMAPNETVTISIVAQVASDAQAGSTLVNGAVVSASNPDSNVGNNDDRASINVDADDTLGIDKIGPATAVPGEPISYEIVISNAGPSAATGVTLNDTLPAQVINASAVSTQGSCTVAGSALTCAVGTLDVGEQAVIFVNGTVADSATGTFANSASATSDDDPTGVNDSVSTSVSAAADLSLMKMAPATGTAGETVTYTLVLFNNGPSTANGVTLNDTLPAGVTFQSANHPSCSETPANSGQIVCSALGSITANGSLQVEIVALIDADTAPGSSIENSATASTTTTDTNPDNNKDDADTSIISRAELSLTKTQSAPAGAVTAGEQVTYTITVNNAGPSTAQFVDIKDSLPAGLSLDSASITRTGSGTAACGGAICQLGDMAVGESATMTVVATVGPDAVSSPLTNEAAVFSNSEENDLSDNTDSVDTTIVTNADLSVEKRDLSDPVGPLGSFLYEIVVTNNGPSDAINVTVTDALDSNVTYLGSSADCILSGSNVVCSEETIPAGGSVDYLISVQAADVISGTVLTNQVNVTTDTPDSDSLNNSDSVTTTVETLLGPSADLSLTKNAPAGAVNAGDTIVYTLVVENDGPQVATNVELLDLIPFGTNVVTMSVQSAPDAAAFCSLNGLCLLGDLPVGGTATVELELRVDANYTGATLINEAVVQSDERDPNTANNFDETENLVTTNTTLAVEKRDLADPVIAGDSILYQITVTNTGTADATNVVAVDALPVGTSYAGSSPNCAVSGNTVTCSVDRLAPGEQASFFVSAQTSNTAANNTTVTNNVSASADNAVAVNDSEETTINQSSLGPVDLTLDKTIVSPNPGPLVAGQSVVYEVVIENQSTVTATDVVVYDLLPNGLTLTGTSIAPATSSQGGTRLCSDAVCSLDTVNPGETVTIQFTATLDSDAAVPSSLTNQATVRSANPETNATNNNDAIAIATAGDDTLSISKIGPATANPDELISYQITVGNAGPSAATGVTVSDALPTGLINPIASASQGSCTITAGLLNCAVGTIDAGTTAMVFVSGRVESSTTGVMLNTAQATSDLDTTGVTDDVSTTIIAAADLALIKSATPTAVAGELITYTVTVLNNGPSEAVNLNITDTLPVSTTFISASASSCNHSAGVITCSEPSLAADASWSTTIIVSADAAIEPGSSLQNHAEVSSDIADPDAANNEDYADTSIVGEADLSLEKSGPASVTAGEQITYTIVVTNAGPSVAQFVDVKDDLPAGVTLVDATVTRTGSGPAACGGAICQVGDMAVDEVITITVVGDVDPSVADGTTLTNSATVFSNSPDPDDGDRSDTANTLVDTDAVLTLNKVALDEPVAPEGSLLYQVTVANQGPSDAQNVTITDTLSSDVTFSSASNLCSHDGSATGGLVSCPIGTLSPNGSSSILIAVDVTNVPSGTQIINDVVATTSTSASAPTDSVTSTVEQDFGPSVDLGLTKSTTAASVTAGEQITYTIAVTSAGPGAATNVQLLDLIPAGTSVVSTSADNPDSTAEYCSLGGACYLGTVFPTTVANVTVILEVDSDYSGTSLVNSASVSADQRDEDTSNNFDDATTPVVTSADLSVVKTDLVDPVTTGELLAYQIEVTNAGPSDAVNVAITDTLDANTAFAGASPGCVHDGSAAGGVVTCSIDSIPAGESAFVLIESRVSGALATATTLTNQVNVGSDTPDADPSNNNDSETTLAEPGGLQPTDLIISKIDTIDPVTAGETLTYTVVVTNSGPAVASNVQVVDSLPSGVTFQSASSSQGLCNGGVTCDIGTLAVGASATIEVVVLVHTDQTTALFNQTRVSASNPDINDANNEASEATAVTTEADLSIVKTSQPITGTAGGTLSYQIVITNAGPSDAQNVVMTDVLPAELNGATFSSSQGSCAGNSTGTSVCSLGIIPAGGSATVSIVGSVDASATGSITNAASVVADNDPTGDSDSVDTAIVSAVDLIITKQDSVDPVNAGETLLYTITVQNLGSSVAPDVVVTDTLPNYLTFIPADSSPLATEVSPGVIRLAASQNPLAVGGTEIFTITVAVDPATPESFSLVNSATVSSSEPDADPNNNSVTEDTEVLQLADLSLSKNGPATVTAGEQITYTIVVTNAGPSIAENVDIKDDLPANLMLDDIIHERSGAGASACGGLVCQFGDVAVNEVITLTVVADVDSDVLDGQLLTNKATVFSDTPISNTNTVSDTATTFVDTLSELTLVKTANPSPAVPGAPLTYEITVFNAGPSDAQNVTISDTLPAGYAAVTITSNPFGCNALPCNVGAVPAGESATVTIIGNLDANVTGSITNNATVSSTTPITNTDISNTGGITPTATVTTTVSPRADLVLEKQADATAQSGGVLTYTLTIKNLGPSDAPNVVITDTLPNEVDFVSSTGCSHSGGIGGGGIVLCPSAPLTLTAQSTISYTITVLVDGAVNPGTSIQNDAEVSSSIPDPDENNNIDDADTSIVSGPVDLVLTKDGPATVTAGEQITYTIVVINNGPSTARNVDVKDDLPPGITLDDITLDRSGSGTSACGGLVCQFGDVAVNEVLTLTVVADVESDVLDGTTLINEATVFSDSPILNAGSARDTANTLVDTLSEITLIKTANPSPAILGAPLTYEIMVFNEGPSDAQNVTISDPLPVGFTATSITSVPFGCSDMPCNVGVVKAGESASIRIIGDLDADIEGSISNSASMTSTTPITSTTGITPSATITTTVLPSADLALLKTSSPTAGAGQQFSYTLKVTNIGPADAPNITITDTLPAEVTFVSAPGCAYDGIETVVCPSTPYTLQYLQNITYTITVLADDDIVPGTSILNRAYVSSDLPDINTTNNEDDVNTNIISTDVNLALHKEGPATVTAGEQITYTIVLTNYGPSVAKSVDVKDDLPAGVMLDDIILERSGTGSNACGGLVCQFGDVAVNEVVTLTVVGNVNADVLDGTMLTNTATVFSDSAIDDSSIVSDTATTLVDTLTELTLVKTANPSPAIPGAPLTYEITVFNAGPSDAQNVTISDPLPAGFTAVTITSNPFGCNALPCNVGAVPAGESATVTIIGNLDANITGSITNNATVSSSTPITNTGISNTGGITPTATVTTTVSPSADLFLEKQAPATATAGERFTYTLTVRNLGPSDASNVVVTDTLPNEVTYVSSSGCTNNVDGTVTCPTSGLTLTAGSEITYTITVLANDDITPGTSIQNTAAVTSDIPDPDANNNEDDADTSILSSNVDLVLIKDGPATVTAGEQITYTIVLTNYGPSVAQNVDIKDNLPAGVSLDDITIERSGTGPTACGGLVCQFGDVAVNEVITLTVIADVDAGVLDGTALTNEATVFSDSPIADTTTVSDTAITLVDTLTELTLVKTANPSPAIPGAPLTYEITVFNAGPSDAQNVTISDPLPAGFTAATITSNPLGCSALPCNVGAVPAGESATVTIIGNLDANITGSITNNATVSSSTPITNTGISNTGGITPTATVTTTVSPSADLFLEKQASATATAGEQFTYTLTVRNLGPSDASNVVVTDTLPNEVTYVSSSGCTNNVDGTVICPTSGLTLTAGSEITYTVTVLADDDIEPGTSIENRAEVISTIVDPDMNNNVDDADTSIISIADLSLRKDGPVTVTAGTQITYTIVVTNSGPSTAHFVDVKEDLPTGISLVDATMDRTGSGQAACGGAVCQMGDMPVGEAVTITVVGLVDSAIEDGSMLLNEATLFSNSMDPDVDDQSDRAETMVEADATLTLTKVALAESVAPNGSLLYQITVMNEGPSDAQNVVIRDLLSSDVRFASASASCSHIGGTSGGLVTCALGTLPASSSSSVLLAVQVDNLPDGTQIVNTAEATTDTSPVAVSDTVTSTVTQDFGPTVDLGLEKSTNANAIVAGERITYTLVVTSNGPGAATNVQLQEFVPAGATITNISIDNPDALGEYCSLGGICYLATVFPDTTVTVVVTLQVEAGYLGSTVQNSASIRADQADSNMSNNFDEVTTPVEKSADLGLIKSDLADPVRSGELLLYQLAVTNHGPSDAEDVVLTDMLSGSTIFAGATAGCVHDDATTGLDAGGAVACTIPMIAAGETKTVLIETRISDAIIDDSTLRNWATVDSSTSDPDLSNNEDTEETLAKPGTIQPTDLVISKTDMIDPVMAGTPLTYTLVVTNVGPAVAYNVQIADAIPTGVTYQYAGSSQGSCNDSVICSIGTLGVGETATVQLIVLVDSAQTTALFNRATVSASNADINEANNSNTEVTGVQIEANLSIVKNAQPEPAFAGSMLNYQIDVSNAGPSDARNVVMTELLPDALLDVILSSSQGVCTTVGVCPLGTVPAGESATVNVIGRVDPTTTGSITNSASVAASNSLNGDSTEVVTKINNAVDLSISKVSDPALAIAGGTIVYTITVENLAGSAAPNVVVTDTLPSYVTFDPSMSSPNVNEVEPGVLVFTAIQNPLHVGATEQFTVGVALDPETPESLTLINRAEVSSAVDESDPSNNRATAENNIGQLANLVLEKRGSSAVVAGSAITYTIVLTNYGPSVAESLQIQDVLPTDVRLNSVSITRSGIGAYSCTDAISCVLGDMEVNEVVTVTIMGIVDAGVSRGTLMTNEAMAFTDSPVSDLTKLTDSATTLIATAVAPAWDASVRAPASVGNWVWFDEEDDGIKGPEEAGVENVLVMLYDEAGNLIDTTITTADGFYEFTYLPPGVYTINFSAPPGMEFTEQVVERANQYNSDADPETGSTDAITLGPGEHQSDWGAGLIEIRPTSLETVPEYEVPASGIYLPFLAR